METYQKVMLHGQIAGMKPHDLRRQNLLHLIETRFDGNKGRFADAIGRKRPQVYRLFSDSPTSRRDIGEELAREIERILGLRKGELDQDAANHDYAHAAEPKPAYNEPNVVDVDISLAKVPVISWVQAGGFMEVVDNFADLSVLEWINVTVPVRRYTFGLKVQGDSMEPDFKEGSYVVVEPELDWQAGDYVVVRNGENEATFKQLIKDGGDWYLKPLNPRYPIKMMTPGMQIVGVVREAVRKFR